MRSLRTVLVIAASLSLCVAAFGCGRPPPGNLLDFPAAAMELELASLDPVTNIWESAPWSGAIWLPFPAQTQVRVEHGLGRIPRAVEVYLGFQEMPLGNVPPMRDTPPALASGDLARIVEVTPTTVTVWNDTGGDYFARIVLH